MRSTCLLLLAVFVLSCGPDQTIHDKIFNFDGLIDQQVSELSQRARVIDKVVSVGGTQSDSTFLPSAARWETELETFRQLEVINKSANRSAYKVDDALRDPKSNLKIRQYVSESSPVQVLKFYYRDEFSQLRKIEATIKEKSVLYAAQQNLMLEFEDENGKPLLSRYTIDGIQKMILSDTVQFHTGGQVEW